MVGGMGWPACCHQAGWTGGGVAGGCLTQPPGEEMVVAAGEGTRLDAPEILHAGRAGGPVRPGRAALRGGRVVEKWPVAAGEGVLGFQSQVCRPPVFSSRFA